MIDYFQRILKIGDYSPERLGGAERSSQWPRVRKEHLRKHPFCAVTGDFRDIEVHHCIPFNENPALELDPDNLITLRRDIHLLVGHLNSFRSYNVDVKADARALEEKVRNRP